MSKNSEGIPLENITGRERNDLPERVILWSEITIVDGIVYTSEGRYGTEKEFNNDVQSQKIILQ